MSDQEALINEIQSLTNSVKRKQRALRAGISDRQQFLEETFKPIVQPLKDLSTKLEKHEPVKREALAPQNLPKNEDCSSSSSASGSCNGSEDEESGSDTIGEDDSEGSKQDLPTLDLETIASSSSSSLRRLSTEIADKGDISKKYVLKMLEENPSRGTRNFHVYGVRLGSQDKLGKEKTLMIGDSELKLHDNDVIEVRGKTYSGTVGLFELLFKRVPSRYSQADLQAFKTICNDTNAHKRQYRSFLPVYRNQSNKYKKIISKLFPSASGRKKGSGMQFKSANHTSVIYYNNVNELVDRAMFIHNAMQSGHTGLDNEWFGIIDALKRRGVII